MGLRETKQNRFQLSIYYTGRIPLGDAISLIVRQPTNKQLLIYVEFIRELNYPELGRQAGEHSLLVLSGQINTASPS